MDVLEKWCAEYGVDRTRIDYGFEVIGPETLGITRYQYERADRIAAIRINTILKPYPIAVMAVSWHEFCHADKWILDGTGDKHGANWWRRLWRKPFLALLDLTYTKIVFAYAKVHP